MSIELAEFVTRNGGRSFDMRDGETGREYGPVRHVKRLENSDDRVQIETNEGVVIAERHTFTFASRR